MSDLMHVSFSWNPNAIAVTLTSIIFYLSTELIIY